MSRPLLSIACAIIIALTGGLITVAPAEATAEQGVVDPAPESGSEEPAPPQTPQIVPGAASITGEAVVGSTLEAVSGGWQPAATALSFQWLRSGTPIPGATAVTYVLTEADAGRSVSVIVSGTAEGYETATLTTDETPEVGPGGFTTAPTPGINGSAKVGNKLTAKPGVWVPQPTSTTYQWYRSGRAVPGATEATYTLTASDRDRTILVKVTATRHGYVTTTKASAPTGNVAPGTLTPAPAPKITGSAVVGSTLTAKPGTWGPGAVTLSYQWYRSGTAIKGATAAKYKLANADLGRSITVKVTGKKSGFSTKSRASAATAKVLKRLIATPAPKISGTVKVGSALTAKPGTGKPTKVTLKYQWYRSGSAIKGATAAKYKLAKSDAGKKITVKITGRKPGYGTATKVSAATKTVPKVLTATPTPKVSGTKKVGYTLTATVGAWQPAPIAVSYQWYRSGNPIKGATGAKYKLKTADVGKTVRVKVTGRKSGYTGVSRTSASTSRITYPSRTNPGSSWNCPSWAPIKGNASSMIYHVPRGAYYDRTKPEECFSTEKAARDAGYRRSKR